MNRWPGGVFTGIAIERPSPRYTVPAFRQLFRSGELCNM